MTNLNLNEALNYIQMTYEEFIDVADEMIKEFCGKSDNLAQRLNNSIDNLSEAEINNYILKFSLESYNLAGIKDKSLTKYDCAEMIKKYEYNKSLLSQEGTAAVKDANASISVASNQLAEIMYSYISTTLKTKVDEIHRVVDALKSVLISRMQEKKISINTINASENE